MNIQYCRACLKFGVKMYSLDQNETLGKAYWEITEISIVEENQYVCFECAWLLWKCQKFKMKCLNANEIIAEIESLQGSIEKRHLQVLKSINRTKFTTLSKVRLNPINIDTFEVGEKDDTHRLAIINNESEMDNIILDNENADTLDIDNEVIGNNYEINELGSDEDDELNKDEDEESNISDLSDIDLNALNECIIETGFKNFEKSIEVCINANITDVDNIATNTTVYDNQPLLDSVLKQIKSKKFNPSNLDNYENLLITSSQKKNEDIMNKIYKCNLCYRHYDNNDALENHLRRHSMHHANVATHQQELNIPQTDENSMCHLPQDIRMDGDIDAIHWLLLNTDTGDELHLTTDRQSDISENALESTERTNDKINSTDKVLVRIKIGASDEETDKKQNNLASLKDYVTTSLSAEEAKKEFLRRKENILYQKAAYKCTLCYKFFGMKGTFDSHMKKHTDKTGPHQCEICKLRFATKHRFRTHWNSNHRWKYHCRLCSYVCYCRNVIITHIGIHKGKQYPCPECNQVFRLTHYLNKHKRKCHGVERICVFCGYTVKSEAGMANHINYLHLQEVNEQKGPKCEVCDVHFANELAYKVHLVHSTKHNVRNGCRFCGEIFSNVYDLRLHSRVHPEKLKKKKYDAYFYRRKNIDSHPNVLCPICDKPLPDESSYLNHMRDIHPESDETEQLVADHSQPVCEVCGIISKNKLQLMFHLTTHDEIRYHCDQCDKRFTTMANYRSHRATHADYSFECNVCGKLFKTKVYCRKHMETHSEERSFKCDQCDKSFRTYGSLYTHKGSHANYSIKCDHCDKLFKTKYACQKHMVMTHTGIREHKCSICGKGFFHACDLKYHISHVHDRVPWPKRIRNRVTPRRTKCVTDTVGN